MVTLESEVQRELSLIHRSRNRIGYIPNPLSLVVSAWFQREKLILDDRWWWAIALVALGTILRIVINEVYFTQWSQKKKWPRLASIGGFLLLSCGWGLHFSDIHYHYGPDSTHVAYTLLIIIAFITGGSTSLVADRASYYAFVLPLGISVCLSYLTQPQLDNAYIVLNVFLYLFFSLSNYRIAQKQLQELLVSQINTRKESERLRDIINTVPGFVGLFDKDLRAYLANQATLSLYPDIIGKQIGNLDPHSQWEKFLIDFHRSGRLSDVQEHSTTMKGEEIHAVLNVQRLADGGLIVVSIITTELKEAQKKIREQEAKAQYTAKLASLGQMAAGIAHEVNNPLTIIQGSASVIQRLVQSDPIDVQSVKILSQKMIDTTNRISKTIRSLKALSRNGDKDPMARTSVKEVIEICIELSQQRLRQAGVELEIPDEIPQAFFMGREVQLSQVLVNLLNNSLDAIKNDEHPWIKLKVEVVGLFVHIDVVDSGLGIPKEIQNKIMDPFFTTKDVNEGTGLGLSISKNILLDHGGELILVDGPNTVFRIRLPLVADS